MTIKYLRQEEILHVRRLALGAMLSKGGLPTPAQFVRAGLPPLFRASEWALAEACDAGDFSRFGVGPDERTTPEGMAFAEWQRERLRGKVSGLASQSRR